MATIEEQSIQSLPPAPRNGGNMERLANGLGWFSIGLGLAEILAPDQLARLIGLGEADRRILWRFFGAREIVAGVGILSRPNPVAGMWARVAGDMIDIAALGMMMGSKQTNRGRAAIALTAVLGVTALDVYCSRELTRAVNGDGRVHMTKTIIVNREPGEVFSFWKKLEHFPSFIERLELVEKTADNHSHWRVTVPGGGKLQWEAEYVIDSSDSQIAWHSGDGADIRNAGRVRFERATGGRGTLVRVDFEYEAPGGRSGAKVAKLFGTEPGQLVETALRRMKQVLETGDIVRSDADVHKGMHPALPPTEDKSRALRVAATKRAETMASVGAEMQEGRLS